MHINDLPDDVLALVFRAVQPAIKRLPADAKSGLGLLSVCRRWRGVALPMVYDTVVVKCGTEEADGPETVDIKTTLDLVVDAKCLHVVRKVVVDARYRTSPLQGLQAVIERMRGAAGKWAGVHKLILSLHAWGSLEPELNLPAADREDEIASSSSALAALMPGLREIKFEGSPQTPITRALYGQLAGYYTDQLQVLHSSSPLVVSQGLVFARLRDVNIAGSFSGSLEGQLPRLDPEVIESLKLRGPTANDMWSMFCADSDGYAISFPRLTHLDLGYRSRYSMSPEQLSEERPWAPQFPAAKHVRITSCDEGCPSMENAVFPDRLESLDIAGGLVLLSVFAGRRVHVSRNLIIFVKSESDVNKRRFVAANRILEAADSCCSKKLVIHSVDAIPLEQITYTRLTHLQLFGSTSVDDVMQLIRRLPHLVSLHVAYLNLDDIQTDFSIPECAEHEPMAPLDTQIKRLTIEYVQIVGSPELGAQMLKYLLLRIPTLKSFNTLFVSVEQLQAFIDEYVQWYPHLANIRLMK